MPLWAQTTLVATILREEESAHRFLGSSILVGSTTVAFTIACSFPTPVLPSALPATILTPFGVLATRGLGLGLVLDLLVPVLLLLLVVATATNLLLLLLLLLISLWFPW